MKYFLNILLVCVGLRGTAQTNSFDSIMPPQIVAQPMVAAFTNRVPAKPIHFLQLSWQPSLSPNVVGYNIERKAGLFCPWQYYGYVTILRCLVDCTNGPQAFYTLQSVNAWGLTSQLPFTPVLTTRKNYDHSRFQTRLGA